MSGARTTERRTKRHRAVPATWIRRFCSADLDAVLSDLSDADRREGAAIVGVDKLVEAVHECVDVAAMAWTALSGDEVVFVFGVTPAPQDDTKGAVWFLFTHKGEPRGIQFAQEMRSCISKMHEKFGTLLNVVDARNGNRIQWLQRLGFTILPSQPMGLEGQHFHPFFKEAT